MKKRSAITASLAVGALTATALSCVGVSPALASDDLRITAGYLSIGLDSTGTVTSLSDIRTGTEYLVPEKHAPLVSLVIDGEQQMPTSVTKVDGDLEFSSDSADYTVTVDVEDAGGYSTFEVTDVDAPAGADVESLLWGPLPTSITETVGEVVGVARNDSFALGMRPLTDRTEGGWPQQYDDLGWKDEVSPNPSDLEVWPHEEWSVAGVTPWGTLLRAFQFDYSKERMRSQIGGYDIPVGPLAEQPTVLGSKVAIFGADPSATPTVLSEISQSEGLPYPTIDGQWQKVAQATSQSFLVLGDLNTGTLAEGAEFAKLAGIDYLYSLPNAAGPWQATGHYEFNTSMGQGDAGVAEFVERAEKLGIKIGVHTLSDFVASNDAYVTAPADDRLALGGRATLTRPLSATATTAYLSDDALLRDGVQGRKLRIGDEFIDYSSFAKVGDEWEVRGLSRARWGSAAVAHDEGATAARLLQNQYGGALGNIEIIDEIATRLSTIWNDTGIRAMSFDGLESASQSGWGSFGMAQLVDKTRDRTENNDGFITETSRMGSNIWDGLSRASWGEVASTSMNQVFINNEFYAANYLPHMMGWIRLSGGESLVSIEHKLARAAGLNAGTGFQGSVGNLRGSGQQARDVLDTIKQWERARNVGAFSEELKAKFRDQSTNWHLEVVTEGSAWTLQQTDAAGAPIGDPIAIAAPTPQISTSSLPNAVAGELYEQQVESNNPTTVRFEVTSGSLPKGLKLNKDTGGIIGTPEKPGTSKFTVTAHNSAGLDSVSKNLQIQVRPFGGKAAVSMKAPLSTDDPVVITVRNPNEHALKNLNVTLSAGDGWTATPASTIPKKLAPGVSVEIAFDLAAVPDAASARTIDLRGAVTYDYPGSKGLSESVKGSIIVPLADISLAFNNVGITHDDNPGPGNVDGARNSYSAEALAAAGLVAGAEFTNDGITYTWPSAVGTPNNVNGSATFKVAGEGDRLGFLGSAIGSQSGTGVITYTDGTTQQFTLSFENWGDPEPGDAVANSTYRNTQSGPANHGYSYRVFAEQVELAAGKRVHTVTLPNNGSIHVFAAAIG
ncbi:Ig domain-containing protein [Microbacterium sp. H1-D42]|uniref:Ig domain-containing protein n=1 Tax=Microbacterium sp. H1-D42 TaxID=2925844 RepID=UPI001F5391FD|nr:Ig domain-containing protein [Microbacterium sp. H1-D42]UNK70813.1 Ig domain-containing protein [Microbacterium sp. H1-D42]